MEINPPSEDMETRFPIVGPEPMTRWTPMATFVPSTILHTARTVYGVEVDLG